MSYIAKYSEVLILLLLSWIGLVSGHYVLNCDCGVSGNTRRIRGGSEVPLHKFPWMVAVEENDQYICGATLINDRYILSAGHCFKNTTEASLAIYLRQHNRLTHDGLKLAVAEIIRYPHFKCNGLFCNEDIALLKLESPIEFSRNLLPICLPDADATYENVVGSVAGWGVLGKSSPLAETLQHAKVDILSKKDCDDTIMRAYMTEDFICADAEISSFCGGDSGGSLMTEMPPGQWTIVGIIAWGMTCVEIDIPGMYTKVSRYLRWISDYTQDAGYCRKK